MGNKTSSPLPSLETINKRFTAREIEVVKDCFNLLSRKLDGTPAVTRDTFTAKHGEGLGPLGLKVFTRLFRVLDGNSSGALEYDEFLSGIFLLVKATRAERMKVLFAMFEPVSSGHWTKAELSAFCCESTAALTERRSQELSKPSKGRGSTTGGEQPGDCSGTPYKELAALMADIVLIKHDVDRDGKLSLSEFGHFAQQVDSRADDVMDLLSTAPSTRSLGEALAAAASSSATPQH